MKKFIESIKASPAKLAACAAPLGLTVTTAFASGVDSFTPATAVTAVLGVFEACWDVIIGNPILIIFLGAGLVPLGFKVFKSAKKAANG